MKHIEDESIDLIITSPPYPMIEMWDELFSSFDPAIRNLLLDDSPEAGKKAFDLMHKQLSTTLSECARVMKDGSICCINIGDSLRSINGRFQLFANHARLLDTLESLGLTNLPYILWKKPTNRPNAFLGSGFLPPNAYVTLDCEYILISRKGAPRKFRPKDPARYESRFSKEERDKWFSQIWADIPGASQNDKKSGLRTGAFPTEIPERLIKMFSVKGDLVLDPFMGTGTSLIAANRLYRRFIGYEINEGVISQRALRLAKNRGRILRQ
ncbi:MAG: site-specific DNA-methyltransferase [Thermoplasmata archaeon]